MTEQDIIEQGIAEGWITPASRTALEPAQRYSSQRTLPPPSSTRTAPIVFCDRSY